MNKFKISRLFLVVLLVAAGVFFAAFVFAADEEEIKAYYQKGKEYYEQGKYEQARKEFEKALLLEEELRKEREQQRAALRYEIAEETSRKQRIKDKELRAKNKEEILEKTREEKSRIIEIEKSYQQGKKDYRKGKYLEAIAGFEEVVSLERGLRQIYTSYAQRYIAEARVKIKEREDLEITRVSGSKDEIYLVKDKGQRAKSKEQFSNVTSKDKRAKRPIFAEEVERDSSIPAELSRKELIENHYREGVAFYRAKDYEKAIAEFEKVLSLNAAHKKAAKYLLHVQGVKLKQELEAKIEAQKKVQEEARLKKEAAEKAKRKQEERAKRETALRRRKQAVPFSETPVIKEKMEYITGEEDTLFISVWEWSDLREEVIVRPDGKISFPLVGDVQAAGLTLTELDKELTEKLSVYIRYPEVSVMLRKFGGRKVVILGEVKNPGVYRPTGRGSLLEAIALAGGFTDDAVLNSIIIVRGDLQMPQATRVDLAKAIKRGDNSGNVTVRPEDMIYVPKKFIANVNYFLDRILGPISRSAYIVTAVEGIGE